MFIHIKEQVKPFQHISDDEVISRIVGRQQSELFHVLYERYIDKIYFKCFNFTKDEATAKDLSHDILVKIFTSIKKFKGRSTFSLWVHSITYHYCIDYLRLRKKIKVEQLDGRQDWTAEENEAKLLKEFKLQRLVVLLDRLKAEDKMILRMFYQDNLPIKKIAVLMGLKESATKMRLKRAKERLAKLFRQNQMHQN